MTFFFLSLSLGKGFTGSRFLRDPMISQGDRHPDDSWDTREPRGLTSRRGMKHVGLSQHLFSRMFLGEGEILGVDKADRCRPRRSSTAYTTLIDYQDIRRKGKFGSALSLHPTLINHSLSPFFLVYQQLCVTLPQDFHAYLLLAISLFAFLRD